MHLGIMPRGFKLNFETAALESWPPASRLFVLQIIVSLSSSQNPFFELLTQTGAGPLSWSSWMLSSAHSRSQAAFLFTHNVAYRWIQDHVSTLFPIFLKQPLSSGSNTLGLGNTGKPSHFHPDNFLIYLSSGEPLVERLASPLHEPFSDATTYRPLPSNVTSIPRPSSRHSRSRHHGDFGVQRVSNLCIEFVPGECIRAT